MIAPRGANEPTVPSSTSAPSGGVPRGICVVSLVCAESALTGWNLIEMFGWIWWNCLARAGSEPFEKSCHVSYVRVTGLDGSGIEGLSLLRSSFCPIAFFCSDWLTDWVFPPEPLEPDEPQPAATTRDSTQSVHDPTTSFLIPILLGRYCKPWNAGPVPLLGFSPTLL